MRKLEASIIKDSRASVCGLFFISFSELVSKRRRSPRGEGKKASK